MFRSIKDPKKRNVLMNIPKIKGFKICFYEDKTHTPPKTRPFLCFSTEGITYIFDTITTTSKGRKNHYLKTNPAAVASVIEVLPEDTNGILKERSFIDCNGNEPKNINDIICSLNTDVFIVDERDLPRDTIEKIKTAIIESPFTSKSQKDFAKIQ